MAKKKTAVVPISAEMALAGLRAEPDEAARLRGMENVLGNARWEGRMEERRTLADSFAISLIAGCQDMRTQPYMFSAIAKRVYDQADALVEESTRRRGE